MRVAAYYRVSTVRQADKDLSIPDQRRTVQDYCQRRDWVVVEEYVEPGRSGRDDNRPSFQRMVEEALRSDRTFDAIVVHTFSRFFRDEAAGEIYVRKLEKNGVVLLSATEDVGTGIAGETTRRIMGLMAELENKQRAARVRQTMEENARQGFWNGGHAPYGFQIVEAERRGDTIKKKLAIEPKEAEIVRLMFRLALQGDGSGPLGIKGIVDHLNRQGFYYRNNRPFRTNEVHRILRSTTCMGLHHYNRKNSKTNRPHDPSTWIPMEVPTIVDPETFEAVQQHLSNRRHSVTPARLSNGSMLLTRIARCPHCCGGMSLRTGKSGRYRYYACSASATKGKSACPGRSISMDQLDNIVLDALKDRLLNPDRLKAALATLVTRLNETQNKDNDREQELSREKRKVDQSIERLLEAVEGGLIDDEESFRKRMAKHRQRRDELTRLIAYGHRRRPLPPNLLSQRNLKRFARTLREHLDDSRSKLRRGYVRMLVDRVTVGDEEIEIRGSNTALLEAAAVPADIEKRQVPSSIPEWRRGWDSNPRYLQEAQRFSRPPRSTTPAPLRKAVL